MPFSIRSYRLFPVQCAVTYNAGLCSLIAILLLSVGPAYAEWVAVSKSDAGATIYADPDTSRRKGNVVKVWHLFDYETVQTNKTGSYLSSKSQREYDCVEESSRLLTVTSFSGNMGKGNVVFSDHSDAMEWQAVEPGSVGQSLWELVCTKK